MTRLGNLIPSTLPNLIQHTEVVGVPEWKDNQDIFYNRGRIIEELEEWNILKVVELVSNHVAGNLGKGILRNRRVDT